MIPYFDGYRTAFKHPVQFHTTRVSIFIFSLPTFMLHLVFCMFVFFVVIAFLNMQNSFDIVL